MGLNFKERYIEATSVPYREGVDFYYNRELNKLLRSPYPLDSPKDLDWLDGYFDAWFLEKMCA